MKQLPKKWFIARTKGNSRVLNEWSNKTHKDDLSAITDNDYIFSDRKAYGICDSEWGYKEITFGQFQKFVLNEAQKIIGYKVPMDLFDSRWRKGDIAEKYNLGIRDTYCVKERDHVIPSEIVETWEPVYEDITIKIGEYKLDFTSNKVIVEGIKYGENELRVLIAMMKRGQIKYLKVGCSGQYTLDLNLLTQIYERVKKC